jgi:capsular polysaccharide biosynthesis protein
MSGQALDLRRSAQIVRQRKTLVGAVTAMGLLAGAAYTAVTPASYLSSAFVAISPSVSVASQTVVATGAPVLSLALPSIKPAISFDTLYSRVRASRAATDLMSVSAVGTTPDQAVETANAVARSYVAYVSSANNLVGQLPAQVFQPAPLATGTPLARRLLYAAGPGVLVGLAIGMIIALAIGRSDRRLRERDEIADSIGVPVLASARVRQPAKAADWTKLFQHYEPDTADAWRLRNALRQLRGAGLDLAGLTAGGGPSLAVLSLAGDRRALALGPQLAVFATSMGIPVALVVGPQQDANTTAALRAACAAVQERSMGPGNLRVTESAHGDASQLPGGVLSVVVAVVDGRAPRVASTMRTTITVLGVTSGAVTAQQLARAAASAAADGRDIAGILVADPDPADQTTGLLPQLARTGEHRMPTRISGAVTEVLL